MKRPSGSFKLVRKKAASLPPNPLKGDSLRAFRAGVRSCLHCLRIRRCPVCLSSFRSFALLVPDPESPPRLLRPGSGVTILVLLPFLFRPLSALPSSRDLYEFPLPEPASLPCSPRRPIFVAVLRAISRRTSPPRRSLV